MFSLFSPTLSHRIKSLTTALAKVPYLTLIIALEPQLLKKQQAMRRQRHVTNQHNSSPSKKRI